MCVYTVSSSEELKPSFAYSTAPLICKSHKTAVLLFQEEKCVRKAQARQNKASIQCASSQKKRMTPGNQCSGCLILPFSVYYQLLL